MYSTTARFCSVSFRSYLLVWVFFYMLPSFLHAQSRQVTSLNSGWQFVKGGPERPATGAPWQPVSLPHSWNTADVMDDEPGYYRGAGWYRRLLPVETTAPDRQLYLRLEGANQVCSVYVNGQLAATHTGGYTAFQVYLSPYLFRDTMRRWNELLIRVDNSYNPQVPPLTADFTFLGGLYRDAWLISLPAVHFDMAATGNDAVYVYTPQVNAQQAQVQVRGQLINKENTMQRFELRALIADSAGRMIVQSSKKVTIKPGQLLDFSHDLPVVKQPTLWNPDRPYLYSITTQLADAATGQVIDQVVNPLGFRWYRFDADSGFYLNGKSLKLIGASRHQDRPGIGNALSNAQAWQDIEWLKKTGANFLRVAHYPQDPAILEACDRLGILTSVEIPVVNEITESDSFYNNCLVMQREMIRQNFNHPSVIMWCYMNEILLRPHFNGEKERQQEYFKNIARLAGRLDSLTRAEDKERYTFMACHGAFDRYNQAGLARIPMVLGWNLYSGWYGGVLADFPSFLEKHHKELPQTPLVVSEYGADADPRIRSIDPVRFDKSVEYAIRFHQYYWAEMKKRPYVAAAMVWNLADFNSETREETMPHINNKGLLTWHRKPKDTYYLYQAAWRKDPVLKITSSAWQNRAAYADNGNTQVTTQLLQAATNADSAELIVNGHSLGWRKPVEYMAEWNVPFVQGSNVVVVRAQQNGQWYKDECEVSYDILGTAPGFGISSSGINVLLGANRYFIDEESQLTWVPDRPYQPGGWGSVGGTAFKMTGSSRQSYGSDKAISGTDKDPVYQTQLVGLQGYKLDVPAGSYELTLHFAELQGAAAAPLAYNLSSGNTSEKKIQRVFNVTINGQPLLQQFDIAAEYGVAAASSVSTIISVREGQGIDLRFTAIKGEPVLNALQLRKKN
ncbi:MAG: glycoside hydrolase family 2 TIM barrel-domain containing protein [Chitinophagaceae bacterium]